MDQCVRDLYCEGFCLGVIGVSDYNMKDSITHQHLLFMGTSIGTEDTLNKFSFILPWQ